MIGVDRRRPFIHSTMANSIALAAALSRIRTIVCPHCGKPKAIVRTDRKPRAYRICPHCHKRILGRIAGRIPEPPPATTRRKPR